MRFIDLFAGIGGVTVNIVYAIGKAIAELEGL